MAGRWFCCPDGQWCVLIPEHEVHLSDGGRGTYDVEKRDGTVDQELVVRVGAGITFRGVRYRLGVTDRVSRDRANKVPSLSTSPPDPHRPRLTKNREEVIAPMSVLEVHYRSGRPIVVDDSEKVWPDREDPIGPHSPWTHEGVRMGRCPVRTFDAP